MFFGVEQYSKDTYVFPFREDDQLSLEEKRSKAYSKQMAEAMYSYFLRNKTWWGYGDINRLRNNRAYALGEQDRTQYMDAFYGKKKESTNVVYPSQNDAKAKRRAYANINFDIMSPMPKIMDMLVGKLPEMIDRVSIDALDVYSNAEKQRMKWGAYVDARFQKELDSLKALAGIDTEEPGFVPRNIEELNLYEAEGGFILPYEEVMEQLVKIAFETSKYDQHIVENIAADLVTGGFACLIEQPDPSTGEVKLRYCDPEFTGIQYSREDRYNNGDYGFHIDMVKLSTIRKLGICENPEELVGLANQFAGQFGNSNRDDWDKENKHSAYGYAYGYDDYVVPVFNGYWIDMENIKEIEHTNRQGRKSTRPYNGKNKMGNRDSLLNTRRKMLYGCKWIIGTEYVYDYGVAKNQSRDGLADPVLPYRAVKVSNKPLMDRVRPALDQFQNGWIKLQHGASMATLNGITIELSSISNLSLGNKKLDPLEVIKMWRQTGILFRKDRNIHGKINQASRAIDQIPGGAGAVIDESLSMMNNAMMLVESLTGINPVILGQAQPNQGKAVTEYAIAGTNDVLKNIVKQMNILKSEAAYACCLRFQYIAQKGGKVADHYKNIVGETRWQLVKEAEGQNVKYGIQTHVRPTEAEIAILRDAIKVALQNGRDGKAGITISEATRFNSMIDEGVSLKRISQMLGFAIEKAEQRAEAKATRMAQLNMQQNSIAAQQSMQEKQMELEVKGRNDFMTYQIKGITDIFQEAVKRGEANYEEAISAIMGFGQPQQPMQQQPQQAQQPPQQPEQPQGTEIPAGKEGV